MRLVQTPPIRRLFIPKPGYVLFEGDLKRADPQVCAKEAGEESLLQIFRDNIDIYRERAKWLYETQSITKAQRQWNKNAINAADYYCQYKTMATTLHTTEEKAKKYLESWCGHTGLYPGIGRWHRRIDNQLRQTSTVYNAYGFRRFYTDRHKDLLPKALAWICSSVVSITIDRGMKHVFGPNPYGNTISEEDRFDPWSGKEYVAIPKVQLLMQIHDSIIGQFPAGMENEIMPLIKERMEVEIPYQNSPLIIPITFKVSKKGIFYHDCPHCKSFVEAKKDKDRHEHLSWGDLPDWYESEAA